MSKSLSLEIPKQSKLREAAEQLLVHERVVLKRWLAQHGGFPWDINRGYHNQDVEYLASLVRDRGGDPELLRSRGREIGVKRICEHEGLE